MSFTVTINNVALTEAQVREAQQKMAEAKRAQAELEAATRDRERRAQEALQREADRQAQFNVRRAKNRHGNMRNYYDGTKLVLDPAQVREALRKLDAFYGSAPKSAEAVILMDNRGRFSFSEDFDGVAERKSAGIVFNTGERVN